MYFVDICWGFQRIAQAGIWNLKEHCTCWTWLRHTWLFSLLSSSSMLLPLVSCPQYKDICKAKPSPYWQCWHVRGTVYVPCHYKTSPCITLQLRKLFYVNDTKSSPCFFRPYWDRNRIPIVEAGGHRAFLLFTCSNHLNKGIQQDIWECLV